MPFVVQNPRGKTTFPQIVQIGFGNPPTGSSSTHPSSEDEDEDEGEDEDEDEDERLACCRARATSHAREDTQPFAELKMWLTARQLTDTGT